MAKYDYEYERNGTSNLFLCFAPLHWRHVKVTARRTMVDFAHCTFIHFPQADTIVVVLDNLNRTNSSLYEAKTRNPTPPSMLAQYG